MFFNLDSVIQKLIFNFPKMLEEALNWLVFSREGNIFFIILFSISCLALKRTLRYLHFLQQDEYSPKRFFMWWIKNLAFDKKYLIGFICFFLVSHISMNLFLISLLIFICYIFYLAFTENNPLKQAKIKLNLTLRAKKIFYLSIFFECLFFLILVGCVAIGLDEGSTKFMGWTSVFLLFPFAILVQLIPFILMFSVILLSPFEKMTRNKFLKEAKEKFKKLSPYTLAIVGSYGKSTVKNMLGDILQSTKGNVFWPKAGINTVMGITRAIREKLKSSDKYAIIEMGTYKKGSIKNVCELTPPNAAILTAINHMHLERFKTRENIYEAKTEVITALPKDGILVCNADDDFVLRAYKEAKVEHKYLYGLNKNINIKLDAYLADISYSENGSTAKIYWENKEYELKTKIIGRGGLSSLLACFTMACALGDDPKFVLAVIQNIEPLSNRLVLKKYPNNLIYLEDGYNSNPVGFDSALDVLKNLDVKRRIVMTPGIIELGKEQFEENYKIAKKISKFCDMVFFVGEENKLSFKKAFDEENFKNVAYVENRDKVFELLSTFQNAGDAILIENDLPDWYESDMKF